MAKKRLQNSPHDTQSSSDDEKGHSKLQADKRKQLDSQTFTPRVNGSLVNLCLKSKVAKEQDSLLVYFGGESWDSRAKTTYHNVTFALSENSWTKVDLPDLPAPRSGHQALLLDLLPSNNGTNNDWRRCFLVWGGEMGSPNDTRFVQYSDAWLFTTNSISNLSKWVKVEQEGVAKPCPRAGHRLLSLPNSTTDEKAGDSMFLLFGGYQSTPQGQLTYLNDLWLGTIAPSVNNDDGDDIKLRWKLLSKAGKTEFWPCGRSAHHMHLVEGGKAVLLIGGYCAEGSLWDCWSLNVTSWTWTERKMKPNPSLSGRSGLASLPLRQTTIKEDGGGDKASSFILFFGGIKDSVVQEEFLAGTCHADFWLLDTRKLSWRPLEITGLPGPLIPGRFNASLAQSPTLTENELDVVVGGGIAEVGEDSVVLDDWHLVRISVKEAQRIYIKTLVPLSVVIPEPRSHSSSSSNPDSSSSDSSSDSPSSYSNSGSEESVEKGNPVANNLDPKRGESLKDFFERTSAAWIDKINADHNNHVILSEKEARHRAFAQARLHYAQMSLDGAKL